MLRGVIGPFVVYYIFRFLKVVLSPVRIVFGFFEDGRDGISKLGLEAGVKGWEIREYQELFKSAVEYYDEQRVTRLFVKSEDSYAEQVVEFVTENEVTHYGFSSRSSQNTGMSRTFEIIFLAVFFFVRGITPIVFLADFHNRKFRTEAIIVSAFGGLVVTMVSSKSVKNLFPHKRIIGPHVMPFSRSSAEEIRRMAEDFDGPTEFDVVFSGSLYEPRETTLNDIKQRLESSGISLEILTRLPGGVRVPEDEYWKRMFASKMVITTADQTYVEKGGDFLWIPHMVYRYLEVLLTGRLLVAPYFPGVERFFVPDEDFLSFENCEQAAEKIEAILTSSDRMQAIQETGQLKANALLASSAFWYGIDAGLGSACIR